MAYDFTADSDIQSTLSSDLTTQATAFEEHVNELYTEIGNLGNSWKGEDYTAFQQGTDGYKTALADLKEGIDLFAKHFSRLSEGTTTLGTDLSTIIENATNGGTAGGSAAPGQVPGADQATQRGQTKSDGSYNPYGGGRPERIDNGDGTYSYVYRDQNDNIRQIDTWDTNGNLIGQETYDQDGQTINYSMKRNQDDGSYVVQQYEAGNVISYEEYDSNDNLVKTIEYKYDEDGNNILRTTKNSDGTYFEEDISNDDVVCVRQYDEDGNLLFENKSSDAAVIAAALAGGATYCANPDGTYSITAENSDSSKTETSYDKEGNVIGKALYDENGKKISEEKYDSVGSVISKDEYSYDKDGNITEKIVYDENGKKISEEKYDSDGSVISKNEYSYDGNVTEKIVYDENGLKQSGEKYDSDGSVISEDTYVYNSDGTYTVNTKNVADGTSSSSTYDGDVLVEKTLFDDKGLKQSSEKYDSDGSVVSTDTYIYDKDGNYALISENKVDGSTVTCFFSEDGSGINCPETFDSDGRLLSDAEILTNAKVTADSYLSTHGIDISGSDYSSLPPTAQSLVDQTVQTVTELGAPDGSLDWQDKFRALDSTTKELVLNEYRGQVSDHVVGDSYGITHIVPTDGNYDGRSVVVPELTETDFNVSVDAQNTLRNQNAQIIIDSANAVRDNLLSEKTALEQLKTSLETNSTYLALPSDQQSAILDTLDNAISSRNDLSNSIKDECYTGGGTDGTIGDASTYFYSVEGKALGNGSRYEDYHEAAVTAEAWNDSLTNLDTLQKITAKLNSYGVFF